MGDGLDGFPVPDGVPAPLWRAVRALRAGIERIDGEAEEAAHIEQDDRSGEYVWCSEVARLLAERLGWYRGEIGEARRP